MTGAGRTECDSPRIKPSPQTAIGRKHRMHRSLASMRHVPPLNRNDEKAGHTCDRVPRGMILAHLILAHLILAANVIPLPTAYAIVHMFKTKRGDVSSTQFDGIIDGSTQFGEADDCSMIPGGVAKGTQSMH